MAQIRKTTYLCDSCGKEVEKKGDLRTLQVVPQTGSGYDYNRAVRTDLCEKCEDEFVISLGPYVKEEDLTVIATYRRSP
jgi:uncharacterized protein YlaI